MIIVLFVFVGLSRSITLIRDFDLYFLCSVDFGMLNRRDASRTEMPSVSIAIIASCNRNDRTSFLIDFIVSTKRIYVNNQYLMQLHRNTVTVPVGDVERLWVIL